MGAQGVLIFLIFAFKAIAKQCDTFSFTRNNMVSK